MPVNPRAAGHVTSPNFWKNSQRSRSQRNVTYSVKNCNDSVLGKPINFTVGADMWTTQISAAQIGCHGDISCVATGPQSLQYLIEYFKN